MSKVLSASSNTILLMFSNLKLSVFCKWYNNLPGVENNNGIPLRILLFSWFVCYPPTKHPVTIKGSLFKHLIASVCA